MKVAAFIAGDKNIIRSSLVVFASLQQYERNVDCFLFLSDLDIQNVDKEELKHHNITIEKLPKNNLFTKSLSWPKEVFLNYFVPNVLCKKGYDICLKLDHDILVVGKLDIEKNRPKNEIFSLIEHNYEKLSNSILDDYDFYKEEFNIGSFDKKSIMFGNVIIDLKKYVEIDFWNKYKDAFKKIITKSPSKNADTFFADMGLFAIVLEKYKIKYQKMDEKYNTVASHRHLKDKNKIETDLRLIHYAGPKKPWGKNIFKFITNPYYFLLRQYWIDYVSENTNLNKKLEYVKQQNTLKSLMFRLVHSKLYLGYVKLFLKVKGNYN
jgi:lipopolysaccharide biosynthesis glycosyltransferase